MLVLSRKLGERIVVPHCERAVTVIAVEGKAVRLGIKGAARYVKRRCCPLRRANSVTATRASSIRARRASTLRRRARCLRESGLGATAGLSCKTPPARRYPL